MRVLVTYIKALKIIFRSRYQQDGCNEKSGDDEEVNAEPSIFKKMAETKIVR